MKAIEVIDAISAETKFKKEEIESFFKISAKLSALYLTDHQSLILPGIGTFNAEISGSKKEVFQKRLRFRPVKSLFTATPIVAKNRSSKTFAFLYFLNDRSDFSVDKTIEILNSLIYLLKTELLQYEKISLPDWGSFRLKPKEKKSGHNSEIIFKPSKYFLELLNSKDLKDEKEIDYDLVSEKEETQGFYSEENLVSENEVKDQVRQAVRESTMMIKAHKRKEKDFAVVKKTEMWRLRFFIILIAILSVVFFIFIEQNGQQQIQNNSDLANLSGISSQNTEISTVTNPAFSTADTFKKVIPKPDSLKAQKPSPKEKPKILEHIFTENDNMWRLAKKYYNDGSLWPLIMAANPEKINDPDKIRNNTLLKIILLEGTVDSLTVNDRAELSEAFNLAYQRFRQLSKSDTAYLKNRARFFSLNP